MQIIYTYQINLISSILFKESGTNGMPGVRESFGKQFDLFSGVLDLIIKSWSGVTTKQYAPRLKKRFSFCYENGLQPLNADVTSGAEFLTQYFRKYSCEYSSVNAACSALSPVLPAVNGFTFGEQPLIKRLLRGMFKGRPTFLQYTVTYHVKHVVDYVKTFSISSETSLELTSNFLATMMRLLSGRRSQTLASLSTNCMHLDNSGCVFYISKLLKTSRPKSHQQPIEFKGYPHDVSLCVVALIKLYLDKTAALRHDVNSMLFISYASPLKPESSRTLAKWVSDISHKAGIHAKTFKSHSLRSASTSNALVVV